MCLLSFAQVNNSFVITSNRDIDVKRPSAEKLSKHQVNGKIVWFPKDYKGGSWLVHDEMTLMILLNGGAHKHEIKEKYRLSRGRILIDLFARSNRLAYWNKLDLIDIEPFTVVYYGKDKQLTELIWDGKKKQTTILDSQKNHIWLSSTLYSAEERRKMKQIFDRSHLSSKNELFEFNRKFVYEYIKSCSNSKNSHITTTCHYQFIYENEKIISKEVIL